MGTVMKAAKAWPAAWVSLWMVPPCCSGRALWCCSWRLSEGDRVVCAFLNIYIPEEPFLWSWWIERFVLSCLFSFISTLMQQDIENLGATRVWISKPCPFGLAKAFYPFSIMPWTSLNFYTTSSRCLIFFQHFCDWSPHIHSHGSDFDFWTLLFHWFGTCICSSRLLARWINRYVGPMHFILPAWIYVYYLMLLLILGKNFCKEFVIFGDMDLLSLQQYAFSATKYAVN